MRYNSRRPGQILVPSDTNRDLRNSRSPSLVDLDSAEAADGPVRT